MRVYISKMGKMNSYTNTNTEINDNTKIIAVSNWAVIRGLYEFNQKNHEQWVVILKSP